MPAFHEDLSALDFLYHTNYTYGMKVKSAAVTRFRKRLAPLCMGRQGEIAEAAGISRGHLNRVLQARNVPSLAIAERIAKAAGTTLAEAISP